MRTYIMLRAELPGGISKDCLVDEDSFEQDKAPTSYFVRPLSAKVIGKVEMDVIEGDEGDLQYVYGEDD